MVINSNGDKIQEGVTALDFYNKQQEMDGLALPPQDIVNISS
jgi:hypothetical protein